MHPVKSPLLFSSLFWLHFCCQMSNGNSEFSRLTVCFCQQSRRQGRSFLWTTTSCMSSRDGCWPTSSSKGSMYSSTGPEDQKHKQNAASNRRTGGGAEGFLLRLCSYRRRRCTVTPAPTGRVRRRTCQYAGRSRAGSWWPPPELLEPCNAGFPPTRLKQRVLWIKKWANNVLNTEMSYFKFFKLILAHFSSYKKIN